MNWREALLGARIRRIDAPAQELIAITLYAREIRGALLLGLAPGARGIGWIDKRPPGNAASPLLLQLRSSLEGGRIAAIEQPDERRLVLYVTRGEDLHLLKVSLRGVRGELQLKSLGAAEVIPPPQRDTPLESPPLAATPNPPTPALSAANIDLDALRTIGERLLQSHGDNALDRHRAMLDRAIRKTLQRAERKLAAIEGDLRRVSAVDDLRRNAALVLANLHQLPRSCARAELLDYTSDPPATRTLSFDPALGPKLQAETWFRRARKLERGKLVASERATDTRASIARLTSLAARLASVREPSNLDLLTREADALGVKVEAAAQAGKSAKRPERVPYREFIAEGARSILVGRGPADNDRLTLDHARPHDLWLHTRDEAGAHVVVPLERDEACPPELLCDAATLAAHFSKARGQHMVDVIYTPRRYVTKPRKAPPGLVSVLRERVFRLELEPARLQRLLKAERPRSL